MNRKVVLPSVILMLIFFLWKVPEVKAQSPIVRGRVVDDLGNPIEGARVSCDEAPDVVAWTNGNGDFALYFHQENRNMQVRIWASTQGYIPKAKDIVVSNESDFLGQIELKRLFIEGNLVHATTNEPIAGARITVVGQPSLQATSDSNGHFIIVSNRLLWHPPPGIEIRIEINRSYAVHVLMAYPWNIIKLQMTP